MTVTSLSFFLLIAIGALCYYLVPKATQWIVLLILSIVFYVFAAEPYTFVYILVPTLLAWAVTNGLEKYREKNGPLSENRLWRTLIYCSIVFDILLWFVLKGRPFIDLFHRVLARFLPVLASRKIPSLVAALGMGYYTLQLIGYKLDCYWGNIKPQKNPLKLLLFSCFFPQMTTGPISGYEQLTGLYEKHRISYHNIARGTQRILWGLAKKLILAERVGIIVDAIWSDFTTYHGVYVWIALLLYPIQMYADFSGCMDIVIGAAEIFDIKLIENFRNPFFSKTSQEFWQRWHISLGNWGRDYVLYPVLKSKWLVGLGKKMRKRFGKKTGKFLATAIGMFILWMVMGIWHGNIKYILGVSLWYWVILMLGNLTAPFFKGIIEKYHFRTETFGWSLMQCVRTYLIYAVGAVFFRAAGIGKAVFFFKSLLKPVLTWDWNSWVLFDGSILSLGVTYHDMNVIAVCLIAVLIVAILSEKYGYARNWVDKQPVFLRWTIYILLLFFVLIFADYGPDYDPSGFIYGQF